MANVPVSVSSNQLGVNSWSFIDIGGNLLEPPGGQTIESWWWVVISLTDLSVVCNETTTDGVTVPADVQKYIGNPNYFLFLVGLGNWGGNFPQGALYTTLVNAGAASILPRMGQMVEAVGTGYFVAYSYIFAGTLADNDLPGFEVMSQVTSSFLEFQFMPVQYGSQTIYTPVEQFGSQSTGIKAGKLPTAFRTQQAKK